MYIDSDTVTMTRILYQAYMDEIAFLNRLRAAGVENWEGYSEAQDDGDDEPC